MHWLKMWLRERDAERAEVSPSLWGIYRLSVSGRGCAACLPEERRLLDAVLFKAGVELGSRQTEQTRGLDLLPFDCTSAL